MHVIDILSFSLSVLGIYGPILLILYLLPRNVAPRLSTILDETQQLLRHAEEVGAVLPQSEYQRNLDRLADHRTPDRSNVSCLDIAQQTISQ